MSKLIELLDLSKPLNDVDKIFSDKDYIVLLISLFYKVRRRRRKKKMYYIAIAVIVAIDERKNKDEEGVNSG
jgi:hypothetical protein